MYTNFEQIFINSRGRGDTPNMVIPVSSKIDI